MGYRERELTPEEERFFAGFTRLEVSREKPEPDPWIKPATKERVDEFVAKCGELVKNHHYTFIRSIRDEKDKDKPIEPHNTLYPQWNKKYIRIVEQTIDDPERKWKPGVEFKRKDHSVYCFIEISTGNIYKANTWSAPYKKIIRGNIWKDNHDIQVMRWHGPVYLR